ncbi:hypothetical protein BDZ89DRAFT_1071790 [Hymenopellis radicata]|nr:hypothetical protein BDZ89DRAFT_1071790 [Hymenopellis radicata]
MARSKILPSQPALNALPVELKLMIIDELKNVDTEAGLHMREIWPEIASLIFSRLIDQYSISDEAEGQGEKEIGDLYQHMQAFPDIKSATKSFYLINLCRLEFHELDFDVLELSEFGDVMASMSTLNEVNVRSCKLRLAHLYAVFNSTTAGLETMNLSDLHVVEFEATLTTDVDVDLYRQPDVLNMANMPKYTGVVRVKELILRMMSRDDYLLMDLLSTSHVALDVQAFNAFSLRLRRFLAQTRSTMHTLSIRECNSMFDSNPFLSPIDMPHLSTFNCQTFVAPSGRPQPILKWFGDTLSALPMRSKLEEVSIDVVILEYDHVKTKLPTDQNPLCRKLDLEKVSVNVFLKSPFRGQAEGKRAEVWVRDTHGLDRWVIVVCLPKI